MALVDDDLASVEEYAVSHGRDRALPMAAEDLMLAEQAMYERQSYQGECRRELLYECHMARLWRKHETPRNRL